MIGQPRCGTFGHVPESLAGASQQMANAEAAAQTKCARRTAVWPRLGRRLGMTSRQSS
jgi:hypothetical protein